MVPSRPGDAAGRMMAVGDTVWTAEDGEYATTPGWPLAFASFGEAVPEQSDASAVGSASAIGQVWATLHEPPALAQTPALVVLARRAGVSILSLSARKAKLARALVRKPAGIVFNEHTDEDGVTVFSASWDSRASCQSD
jgi:hypothetical protein